MPSPCPLPHCGRGFCFPSNRRQPAAAGIAPPADDRVVAVPQAPRDRADLSVADREAVDREDGADLVAAAAEEGLVGDVELAAVDLALLDGEAELLGGELEERRAGHALEDRGGDRRGD